MSRILNKIRRDGVKGAAHGAYTLFVHGLRDNMTYYIPKSNKLFYRKPHVVFTETTNHCNFHCRMCFRGKREAGKGFMSFSLFKKVVDEAVEIGDVCLMLHFSGETTLHPQFNDMVRYAMSKRSHLYNVGFFTNGSLLDKDKAQLIVDEQVDWVTFSMDGVGKVNDDIRVGGNYAVLEQNILNLLTIRGDKPKPIVGTNTTITTQTPEQLRQLRDCWTGKVDSINFNGCINENFNILNENQWHQWNHGWKLPKFCTQPFYQMSVLWNGDVTYCCHDLNGYGNVGNVTEHSLMSVWRSDAFRRIREGVLNGCRMGLCAGCEKWKER